MSDKCPDCNGTGWVPRRNEVEIGARFSKNYKACETCAATARIAEVPPQVTLIDKIPEDLWNADDADDWNINAGCNDEATIEAQEAEIKRLREALEQIAGTPDVSLDEVPEFARAALEEGKQ